MSKSKTYTVIEEFESKGVSYAVGEVLELTDAQAKKLLKDKLIGEVYEGEMASYKVLKSFPFTDEDGNQIGETEEGSVQNFPVELANPLVEQGLLEKIEYKEPTVEVETDNIVEDANPNLHSYYSGKLVKTQTEIKLKGLPYVQFTLEDGTGFTVPLEEFNSNVEVK